MAQETKRGCGYRKVGGLYLCGEYRMVPCDRLPYPLDLCPTCGSGIKVSRGFTKISPLALFGYHQPCQDQVRPCYVCDPGESLAFIMRVGERYYPTVGDFEREAQELGVSKRIPWVPKELELGKTVLYLAHVRAFQAREPIVMQQAMAIVGGATGGQTRLLDAEKVEGRMGIFSAFIPQRVEKLIWAKDATEKELAKLDKQGITPVIIKDGDLDHDH